MPENHGRLDVLRGLLRSSLDLFEVKNQAFGAGWKTSDEVIITHRFLVIRSGEMDYTLDGRTSRLTGGVQFFVPAWSRRQWRTTPGCNLIWCEFSSGSVVVPPVLWRRSLVGPGVEEAALREMARLHRGEEDGRALMMEGVLKAMLARFWPAAEPLGEASPASAVRHPDVAGAITWLERHYAEPDALGRFYGGLRLSPNHFRLLFRRQTGETVQSVLARLRMRRARCLVRETGMPIKRIAAEAGFADPLYFSNQYRAFWGVAPTSDRMEGGPA